MARLAVALLLVTVLAEAVLPVPVLAEAVLPVPVLVVARLGAVPLVLALRRVRGEGRLPVFRRPVFRRRGAVGRRALARRPRPGSVARLITVALLVIVIRPGRTGGFVRP